jgi:hypothetical protein
MSELREGDHRLVGGIALGIAESGTETDAVIILVSSLENALLRTKEQAEASCSMIARWDATLQGCQVDNFVGDDRVVRNGGPCGGCVNLDRSYAQQNLEVGHVDG